MAVPFLFENIVGSAIDITKYVTQVDSNIFQGSGKIRTLSLMLDADDGAFVSNKDYAGVDTTPIISQFDKHEITWTDPAALEKKMIVEVSTELGQQTVTGNVLPLEFKGREAALQRRKFTAYFQFKTPLFVLQRIFEQYNFEKGTAEPSVSANGDSMNFIADVPNNITNIYDFTKEISYYDALMQVVRRLNQPIGQGGVGDFFSLTFTDGEHLTSPQADTIMIHVFIQGSGTVDALSSTDNLPFHSLTYQIHAETGNQIFVRGQQGTGYVPKEFHEFISFVEEINNYPVYVSNQVYPATTVTRGSDNLLYVAKTGGVPVSTPPPNATFWDLTNPDTIIPSINYSQWTKNKVTVTKNGMSNPTATFVTGGFGAPAFYDGNMVIREGGTNSQDGIYTFWRDWATFRTNDEINIGTNFGEYIDFESVGLYNGLRVLVDLTIGAATGNFIGNDKFGRAKANALVVYNGTEWIVLRTFQSANFNEAGNQVVVIEEGRTYEWNVILDDTNDYANAHTHSGFGANRRGNGGVGELQWRDVSAASNSNDVFHHPKSIAVAPGLFPSDLIGDSYSTFTANSSLKIVYEYELDSIVDEFYHKFANFWDNLLTTGAELFSGVDDIFTDYFEPTAGELADTVVSDWYEFGWWYALPFPYPFSTANAISEDVGQLWGGAPAAAQRQDFAVLDLQNPTFTHSGTPGFNNVDAEDIGAPFTGIRFYFLFDIKLGGSGKPFVGNVPFTVTMYDDLSQVWRTDFSVRFLGDAQEVTLPFDSFTVDRPSRTPWGLRTVFQNIVTPEIEIRSIFEPKRVRFITWQLSDSYDDFERYLPVTIENFVSTLFGLGTVTFEGTIDGLTLLKQPFTSSGVITDRVINPETIQMPNTRNLRQLRSVATAIKELHELQFESYNVQIDLDCQYDVEQSIDLTDPLMVKGSPRKLVVMAQELSWIPTGPKAGEFNTLTLTRRLNA